MTRLSHFEAKFQKQGIELVYNNTTKQFPYLWLRDNCKCSACYNYTADEIDIDLTKLSNSIAPKKVQSSQSKFSVICNHKR